MRKSVLVLAALAPVATACVGPESVDVQRRDATGDADVSSRPDGAQDVRPMDAADTGVVPMDVVGVDVPSDSGTVLADAAPDIACRMVCGAVCTDTQVDPRNCGACFRDCSNLPGVDPASARCVAGLCVINRACMPNRGDCNADATDGCETDLGTTMNCGACATSCAEPTPICTMMPGDGGPAMFRCGSGCVAPTPDRCVSRCVDLQTDPRNCGACGTICPAATNGVAACVAGRCAVMCNAGYGDCDGSSTNGCETLTRTSLTHCGTCGNVCPGVMGAMPACNNGVCGIACPTGRGDCDMMTANGCETDTRMEVNHCGACGRACTPAPNATPACNASACTTVCNTGFGNCDSNATNGCEADITTNVLHCGRCSSPCPTPTNATRTCTAGACGFMCNANFGDCNMLGSDGCEVALSTTIAHCGRCGNACPTPANGTATCTTGMCGARCNAGFGDCDANLANGCEIDTNTSMTHCGGCGMVCSPVADSTAACVAGRCQITCNAGFRLVGSTCEREPPRPVFPWAGATVSNRRPAFRVVLPVGQTGGTVQVCTNRACTILETSFAISATGTGAPTVDLAVGRHYFWRVQGSVGGTPTAFSDARQFIVSAAAGATGQGSSGAMLNPNGDNAVDFVGGAPTVSRAAYYQSQGLQVALSGTMGTQYGFSVASAGDVNGDGLTDVLVGTPGTSPGSVAVHFATGTTLSSAVSVTVPSPAGVVRFGDIVQGIGDVNGDGFGDIAVATRSNRVFVFLGRATGPATTPSNDLTGGGTFGTSISKACDVNGDGFADLIVGSDATRSIHVYPGSATGLGATPTTILGPDPARTGFGRSVDCAGDTNGDGYSDVIVGSYDAARAYVLAGSATGLVETPISTLGASPSSVNLGFVVGGVGDYDNDNYADVVVSASNSATSGSGFVVVYWGGPTGPSDTGAIVLNAGAAAVTSLGFSISSGDVNGDGRSDILLGHPSTSAVRAYFARTRATTTLSSSYIPSVTTYASFGTSFAAQ